MAGGANAEGREEVLSEYLSGNDRGGVEDGEHGEDGERAAEKAEPKKKVGFRDRKIIDYENRIRTYSTPDKIFRYFATFKVVGHDGKGDGEIFMTPEDFLRSLTPGVKQPEGLGLDQFRKIDAARVNMGNLSESQLGGDSIFYHLGSHGLISFSDYIFLLTILSTSRRQFEIAFRMFDLNGDGDVDAEEFEQVQEIIRQSTSTGKKHREHGNTGSTLRGKKMNSALATYFFGPDLDGKLTIERFLDFQNQLQREILRLEFDRKGPNAQGRITERQFAELLLAYADYSAKKRSAVLKRVKRAYKVPGKNGNGKNGNGKNGNGKKNGGKKAIGDSGDNGEGIHNSGGEESKGWKASEGIGLEDYIRIFQLLMHIEDVDKALAFYNLAGASIDPATLKHVAKVCADVRLSDHVVDVLFVIFDEDGDGGLSNKEFVDVMKNKLKRGLEKPRDTGLVNLMSAVTKCAAESAMSARGGAGSKGGGKK